MTRALHPQLGRACAGAMLVALAPTSTTTSATATAVGLLPVQGILVDLDALPGVSGKSADRGKNDALEALQQLWDSYLKGARFNVIEIQVDVPDLGSRGAERVAQLCDWSRQNTSASPRACSVHRKGSRCPRTTAS